MVWHVNNTILDELCVTCTLFSLDRLLGTSASLRDFEHATVEKWKYGPWKHQLEVLWTINIYYCIMIKCSQESWVKIPDCNKKHLTFFFFSLSQFPFCFISKEDTKFQKEVLKSGNLPFQPISRNVFWLST